ncbi:hypothetical protein ACFWY9_02235 [Amycolatopsis sp. NPDC059027]|uniref:hypothetical protein n=1 Tax=unclassified Amycolatopsis TaxID=2618356 RepID=UPI00367338C8
MKTKTVLCGVLAVGGLMAVSACSNPIGKSWAITYEVSANADGTLSEASYALSPDRYENKVVQHPVPGPVGVPWKQEVVISAGQKAAVTAMPAKDLTLTCRILLDGTKELAKSTAPAAGAPVTCEKVTDS